MRNLALLPLLLASSAAAAPDLFLAFESAYSINTTVDAANAHAEHDKRDGTSCPNGFHSCANLGGGGVCCRANAICSADFSNNVACCPIGAVCTGNIPTALPTPTVTTTAGGVVIGAPVVATGTNEAGQLFLTTIYPANTNTFIVPTEVPSAGTPTRSTVPNPFYPFFTVIATTYTNAAGCSAAYTSCQTEAAKCTAALGGGTMAGGGGGGVTIVAPGGGLTVVPAVVTPLPTLAPQVAISVCSSLSLEACSGLGIQACTLYDGGVSNMAARRGGGGSGCGGAYYGAAAIAGAGAGALLGFGAL